MVWLKTSCCYPSSPHNEAHPSIKCTNLSTTPSVRLRVESSPRCVDPLDTHLHQTSTCLNPLHPINQTSISTYLPDVSIMKIHPPISPSCCINPQTQPLSASSYVPGDMSSNSQTYWSPNQPICTPHLPKDALVKGLKKQEMKSCHVLTSPNSPLFALVWQWWLCIQHSYSWSTTVSGENLAYHSQYCLKRW